MSSRRARTARANVLRERVLETAYLWHNYGHPTIGARADIEGVPIERLQKFYHAYYQPDNAALIVTGKFDQKATLAYIEKVFGAIPRPARVLPNLYTAEPTQDGERSHAAPVRQRASARRSFPCAGGCASGQRLAQSPDFAV